MSDAAPRCRFRLAGALVAAVLVVALVLIVAHRLAPRHLSTVEPGVLYRSATLPPDQLQDVVDRYGIRTVVNLRSARENEEPWHAAQARMLAAEGVRLVDLPIHSGFPPDENALAGWLDLLADSDAQPLLLHCEYGVVRTGVMVAVYEMEQKGRTGQESWQDFELFGGDLEEPIRSRIEEWIEGYEPRMQRARAHP
jgi:protein tyrosine/serine phosphatase